MREKGNERGSCVVTCVVCYAVQDTVVGMA